MEYLKIQIVIPGARVPKRGREGDAGYDLWALNDRTILPLTSTVIELGFKSEFPSGWVALIQDRSSMGLRGAIRKAGVIDSNFRGEWAVQMFNCSAEPIEIQGCLNNPNAKACAQVIFVPCAECNIEVVEELKNSNRGTNWKGSSDASPDA